MIFTKSNQIDAKTHRILPSKMEEKANEMSWVSQRASEKKQELIKKINLKNPKHDNTYLLSLVYPWVISIRYSVRIELTIQEQ